MFLMLQLTDIHDFTEHFDLSIPQRSGCTMLLNCKIGAVIIRMGRGGGGLFWYDDRCIAILGNILIPSL